MDVNEKYCNDCVFSSIASNEEPCVSCLQDLDSPNFQSRVITMATKEETNSKDQQNQHYLACGQTYQPILVMQAVFSKEELIGFLKGNILKYTCRMGKKEGEAREKEARKVQQYSEWLAVVIAGGQIEI